MAEEGFSGWLIALIVIFALIGFVVVVFFLRKYMQGGQYTKDNRIDGKVVIITGSNTGIGKQTAIDLAKRGGKIYLACRDVSRGEAALVEVKEASGNKNIHFIQLDLSSMESIRQFAKKFHEIENQLHILVNNAGVMASPRALTKDGFEMQIGVNHMGHFLLTNLLLDLLKISAPSRIVVVSSLFHLFGKINKEDLNSEKSYWRWLAYGQSKLANILFTKELSRQLEGTSVTVNALHPGAVNTELTRHVNVVLRMISMPMQWVFFKTPIAGAQTQIRLAVDPDLEKVSGKYFSDCVEKSTSSIGQDAELASWLWKKSEEWTGLSMPNTVA